MGGAPPPDGSTALVLADVSGHGAEAGLVAFAFKQRITALLDTDLDLAHRVRRSPRAAPTPTTSASCPASSSSSTRSGSGSPGSTPATRRPWSSTGSTATARVELTPTGPLISSVTSGWSSRSRSFGPDDLLLACTDGVLEARDLDGRGVRRRRACSTCCAACDRWLADEAVAECREAVRRFAVDVRRDDVTCVALTLALRPVPPSGPDRNPRSGSTASDIGGTLDDVQHSQIIIS